jgi:HEAT repeat protein
MIRSMLILAALATALPAQDFNGPLGFQAQPGAGQAPQSAGEDKDYRRGRTALDASRWEDAIAAFSDSAARKGAAADGALYWKAYAQNRAGQRDAALATLAALRQQYPSSRWSNDAQALEVEIHARTGAPVNPAAESDDDLKLIAINSLMQSDPKQALPILEKLLKSNSSPKLKYRALFVLTQSGSPEARKVLSGIALGGSNPDLQRAAIRYMGMMGGDDVRRELASIYGSSTDKDVRLAILQAFMVSGSREFLLNAAKIEKDPDLRRAAIHDLGVSGGQDELWQLYQSEGSVENKEEILKAMFVGGNSAHLVEVARSEKDPRLRLAAIRSLGMMGDHGSGDVLVSIYHSGQDRTVREAILNALFIQQNGKALVDLARNEQDPQMKKEIINKLALVHSKESTDYMLEILK